MWKFILNNPLFKWSFILITLISTIAATFNFIYKAGKTKEKAIIYRDELLYYKWRKEVNRKVFEEDELAINNELLKEWTFKK